MPSWVVCNFYHTSPAFWLTWPQWGLSLLNCMLMCLACLHAHEPTCLACLPAHVQTYLVCLHAHVPTCFACSCAHMPTCLASLHAHALRALRAHVLTYLACFACLGVLTTNNKDKFSIIRFIIFCFFLWNKIVAHSCISLTSQKPLTGVMTNFVQ